MNRWACVARLGGIGDNLVAASVLRPLKKLGYMTEVITSPLAHTVYLNNPFVDKLTVKEDGDIQGDWHKWFVSKKKEYDVFAHLSHSIEVRHAVHPSSTPFTWPAEYRRKVCGGSYLETAHDIAGVPYDFGPLYFPTEEEKDRAAATRKKYAGDKPCVAWILSGSRVDKTYPYSDYALARMIKELGVHVMAFGHGGKEHEIAQVMETNLLRINSSHEGFSIGLSSNEVKGTGDAMDWPLRRSLAQIMACDVVISPDTGPAWAVAMEAMPKIVLLSHASEENITKHWVNTVTLHADQNDVPCWPCHQLHDDISTCTPAVDGGVTAACISSIKVDDIVTSVKLGLAQKNAKVIAYPRVVGDE